MHEIFHTLEHALQITVIVFIMMIFVDYLNVATKGKLNRIIKGGLFRQYFMTSALGATPGCLGSFMNVTFYIHGLITFGAIVGGMIATSGDEAFIMLAMFPHKAILLFAILFVMGIVFAYLIDKLAPKLNIKPCIESDLAKIHHEKACKCFDLKETIAHLKKISFVRFLLLVLLIFFTYAFITEKFGHAEAEWMHITFIALLILAIFIILTVPDHYLNDHIWKHIAKKHLWKVFLWTFGALLVVEIGLHFFNLDKIIQHNMFWVLMIAALVALIPQSGPHLVFVMLFAKGFIPFSVLLTSAIIQDGHGMLPLLSFSVRDTVLIKILKLIIGLTLGIILYLWGI